MAEPEKGNKIAYVHPYKRADAARMPAQERPTPGQFVGTEAALEAERGAGDPSMAIRQIARSEGPQRALMDRQLVRPRTS